MIEKDKANEKVAAGWLRAWMAFEALAVNKEVVEASLKELVDRLETDERVKVYGRKQAETKEVLNPMEGIEKAYSQVCDVDLISKNLDNLIGIVTEYGPSAIELLEPTSFEMKSGEAQSILNTISELLHRFASAGMGGMVFVRGNKSGEGAE
ncbi:MAG: hypothetical protein HY362_02300 [Candidatus Aenigmarchaeota archaeon]|nr:hypothetical protein [Candidatus Aenigmarchaeota archaeon]